MASYPGKKLFSKFETEMLRRIRHIHLPDRPPFYVPRSFAGQLRDSLEDQIIQQRAVPYDPASDALVVGDGTGDGKRDVPYVNASLKAKIQDWFEAAPPPPIVLSFTRPPTYILPKHYTRGKEDWQVNYVLSMLKAQMEVSFPEPPGWSSWPWKDPREARQDEGLLYYHPLHQSWRPSVLIMPCAEPMYHGPGQLTLWPVMDLLDKVQRGKLFSTKYEFERVLEDTTIQVLQREYGITAFAITGSPGVWVQSRIPPQEISQDATVMPNDDTTVRRQDVRRIATVHADIVNNITRFGVSIHVGFPSPSAGIGSDRNNPWIPLRQHNQTTSIAAELAYLGFVPKPADPGKDTNEGAQGKSRYLQTLFYTEKPLQDVGVKAIPYSAILAKPGLRVPAPLGLDNRDLSTAWTYEFARQLGMYDGFIDHFHKPFYGQQSGLPARPKFKPEFQPRQISTETEFSEPYNQVEIPIHKPWKDEEVTNEVTDSTTSPEVKDTPVDKIRAADDGAVSWPIYHKIVVETLDNSIRGRTGDTRYHNLMRRMRKDARRERRFETAKIVEALDERWANGPKTDLARQSMSDLILNEIQENVQYMQKILATLQGGSSLKRGLQSIISEMKTLLKSRQIMSRKTGGEDEGAPVSDLIIRVMLEHVLEMQKILATLQEGSSSEKELQNTIVQMRILLQSRDTLSTKWYDEAPSNRAQNPPAPAPPVPAPPAPAPSRPAPSGRTPSGRTPSGRTPSGRTPSGREEDSHELVPRRKRVFLEIMKTRRERQEERKIAKATQVHSQPPFLLAREGPHELTPTLREVKEAQREERRERRRAQQRAVREERRKQRESAGLSAFLPITRQLSMAGHGEEAAGGAPAS